MAGIFHILANDTVIGKTALEFGDPPMGVAFGKFVPNDSAIPFLRSPSTRVELGGKVLYWDEGISILTPSGASLTADVISLSYYREDPIDFEVQAFGIPSEEYDALFPEHWVAYYDRFQSDTD